MEVGDLILCTGSIGGNGIYVEAGYNGKLKLLDKDVLASFEQASYGYDERMHRFVEILVKYCKCAVDVSDGLLGDLSHILKHSNCAAKLNCHKLPLVKLDKSIKDALGLDDAKILRHGLSSGGDYNLLFTLRSEHEEAFFNELNADAELKGFFTPWS